MPTKTTMTRIIRNAYGRRYNLDAYELVQPSLYDSSFRDYVSKLSPFFDFLKNKWIHITAIILIAVLTIGTIYYYNSIMICQQNVETGASKVEALMQRRNDISINLAKAVLDYSKYERDVMTGIVALRTLVSDDEKKAQALKKLLASTDIKSANSLNTDSNTASNSNSASNSNIASNQTQSLNKSLPETPETGVVNSIEALNPLGTLNPLGKLMAVAEQYPDLKLSTTFNNLMTALIEVEKDLALERLKYNDQVNKYTTITALFPGNLFAYLFNFPEKFYFQSTDEAKSLVPISY